MLQGLSKFSLDGVSGSNIKSVQSGTLTTSLFAASYDVGISNVDVLKSIITAISDKSFLSEQYLPSFTNSTTINFGSISAGSTTALKWNVTEFNNVKSKQQRNVSIVANTVTDISISAIDTQKYLLIAHIAGTDNTNAGSSARWYYSLKNSNTIELFSVYAGTIAWQLLEFN